MKINIIAIIVLAVLIYLLNTAGFVPQGLEAEAAADQVKTGGEYLQARGEMKVYGNAVVVFTKVFWFFIGYNLAMIFIKLFKKNKQNER